MRILTQLLFVLQSNLRQKRFIRLYDNILRVDLTSKLFLIQEIEDEHYEILFGDGILGKKPYILGTRITVNYIVTNGKLGNDENSHLLEF